MNIEVKRFIDLNNLISFWNKIKSYIDSSYDIVQDDINLINEKIDDINQTISSTTDYINNINIVNSKGNFDPILYPYLSSINVVKSDKNCNIVIPSGNANTVSERLEWLLQEKDNLLTDSETISSDEIDDIIL